jgi:hypothetical protein
MLENLIYRTTDEGFRKLCDNLQNYFGEGPFARVRGKLDEEIISVHDILKESNWMKYNVPKEVTKIVDSLRDR